MSDDPLPLTKILAGSPENADYDALFAEIMATERGRWFVAEYARRSGKTDTQRLLGAIARVETAVRDDFPAFARELVDLAAAVGRVETEIAASGTPTPNGLLATERIQDIAFALREREVDAALCDALEAALRDLCEAFVRNDAAERAQNALALLRDVHDRLDAMIAAAAAGAGEPPEPAVDDAAVAPADAPPKAAAENEGSEAVIDAWKSPAAGFSEAQAQGDKHFADAVRALAALERTDEGGAVSAAAGGEGTGAVAPEPPLSVSVSASAEASSVETSPVEAAAGVPPEPEQIEPPAIETEQAAAPEANVSWEVLAAEDAETRVARATDASIIGDASAFGEETCEAMSKAESAARAVELAGYEYSGDTGRRDESTKIALSSEEFLIETLSGEVRAGNELSNEAALSEEQAGQLLRGDEAPIEEPPSDAPPGEESLAEELLREEVTVEERSVAEAIPAQGMLESAEPALRSHAEDAVTATGSLAADETVGDHEVERLHDTPDEIALASAAKDVEAPIEDEPRHLSPPEDLSAGPEEDPGDLFEPRTPQDKVHAVSGAFRGEPRANQVHAAESPEAAFSAPPMPTALPIEQSLQPPSVAEAPVAREVPRPTPSDPLAALRALSDEERIALFS